MNHWGLIICLILPKTLLAQVTSDKQESIDRSVDQAAIASQQLAIKTLQGLIKKHKGQPQEISLLLKLGESYQQAAMIEFRIQKGNKKSGLVAKYHGDTIRVLSEVIARAPNLTEIDEAYATRGKSYEEIGDKVHAKKDYLTLVKNFPDHPSTSPAYMSLADFAIEDNQHKEALTYLSALEKRDDDPLFPFALFKIAWAHYNLKDVARSLTYLEKHTTFYRRRVEASKTPNPSEEALQESSLADMALFFFEGFEEKLPGYSVSDAYEYFKKQDAPQYFGRMSVRFAKLLRSHRHSEPLMEWKSIYMSREFDRPETLEILTIVFDDFINQNNFKKVADTSRDMVALYLKNKRLMQGEVLSKTQKMILDTAAKYQALTLKNKAASGLEELTQTLATLYDSFTKMAEDNDPRIPRVHYNLAETLFEIKNYDEATSHYRWIVDRGQVKDAIPIEDASLKSISARYESLKLSELVVTDIQSKKYQGTTEASLKTPFKEWVGWIDWHLAKFGAKDEGVSQYLYEANRNLYHLKASDPYLDRLKAFSKSYPSSRYAIPQATLTLDTAILSEQWERAWILTQEFVTIQPWEKTDFYKLLILTGSKSIFKLTESEFALNRHSDVLKHYELFVKKYSSDSLLPQMTLFAAKSNIALNKEPEAIEQLTGLIENNPSSHFVAEAYLLRSKYRQEKEDFTGAASDWTAFLKLDEKTKSGLKFKSEDFLKRILLFATLSQTLKGRFKEIEDAKLCVPADHVEICDHYRAYLAATEPALYPKDKEIEEAKNDDLENSDRALWALATLSHAKEMTIDELYAYLRILGSKFDKNDADIQYALYKTLRATIVDSLTRGRDVLNKDYTLKEDPAKIIKSIQRRVKAMQLHEESMAALMKIPFMGIRAYVLNENSLMYEDFTNALRNYPIPKTLPQTEQDEYQKAFQDILFPFEEKVQAIRMRAFEIASQKAIDEPTFVAVAEGYFKDNPSQAKSIGHNFTKGFRVPLVPDSFTDESFSKTWKKAYDTGNVRLMLYSLPREKSPIVKVLTLERAGLTSEALAELDRIKNKTYEMIALTHHFATLHQKRVKGTVQVLIDELTSEPKPPKINEVTAFIAYYTAMIWTPIPVSDNIRDKLESKGRGVEHKLARDWIRSGGGKKK